MDQNAGPGRAEEHSQLGISEFHSDIRGNGSTSLVLWIITSKIALGLSGAVIINWDDGTMDILSYPRGKGEDVVFDWLEDVFCKIWGFR